MSLDSQDIEKIAQLARIQVSEEESEAFLQDLNRILELVAQMNSVDTRAVIPMAHPLDMAQRLRPDIPTEPNRRDQFQRIAPLTEGGLYLVPQVIE